MDYYTSPSAQTLHAYRNAHPENVVWSPEQGWLDYAQCGECNEPDRVIDQIAGLCVACHRKLTEGSDGW
jgi:hypothetical protein